MSAEDVEYGGITDNDVVSLTCVCGNTAGDEGLVDVNDEVSRFIPTWVPPYLHRPGEGASRARRPSPGADCPAGRGIGQHHVQTLEG
jgi:hypothetical protein